MFLSTFRPEGICCSILPPSLLAFRAARARLSANPITALAATFGLDQMREVRRESVFLGASDAPSTNLGVMDLH